MKKYRTSGIRVFILLIFGTIIAAVIGFSKPNGLNVFLGVEAMFLIMAFAAWAFIEIGFDRDEIVRTIFFLTSSRHPITAIKRLRFSTDEDSFGGRTTYLTIEFKDAKPFFLFDFAKSDLREIVDRISAIEPNAIDPNVTKYLEKEAGNRNTVLRSGDRFLFISGAIVVLLAILWWLIQRFWIT